MTLPIEVGDIFFRVIKNVKCCKTFISKALQYIDALFAGFSQPIVFTSSRRRDRSSKARESAP